MSHKMGCLGVRIFAAMVLELRSNTWSWDSFSISTLTNGSQSLGNAQHNEALDGHLVRVGMPPKTRWSALCFVFSPLLHYFAWLLATVLGNVFHYWLPELLLNWSGSGLYSTEESAALLAGCISSIAFVRQFVTLISGQGMLQSHRSSLYTALVCRFCLSL